MSETIIKTLIKRLSEDLEIKTSEDFLGDLFEERAEEIHERIGHNTEYKKQLRKTCELQEEIKQKFEKAWEIIEIIEEYNQEIYERNYLSEKLIYKQGLLDGILFIIEGAKQ